MCEQPFTQFRFVIPLIRKQKIFNDKNFHLIDQIIKEKRGGETYKTGGCVYKLRKAQNGTEVNNYDNEYSFS